MSGCELYRHYAKDGTLLYVGISISTMHRLKGHKCESSWFDEITVVTIERHPDRESASDAEIEAIRNEKPMYNVAHSPIKQRCSPAIAKGVIINTNETAKILGMDRKTLRNKLKAGTCPVQPLAGIEPPVWHRAAVEAFVAGVGV